MMYNSSDDDEEEDFDPKELAKEINKNNTDIIDVENDENKL